MNTQKKLCALICILFISVIPALFSDDAVDEKNYSTPLQLSFYAPLQLAPEDSDVYGLRLAFPYGVNRNVYGLDVGLWNTSTGNQYGLQIGALLASRGGRTFGLNFGGIANFSTGNEYGVSFAGIYNQADGKLTGLQFASCVSKAKHVRGVQFALINFCDDLSGVQIGLLNFCSSGAVPIMFLINAKY